MSDSSELWRIFIPTRDSSRYISVFFDHYKAAGISPLYIVDGRSADNTYDILVSKGADVHIINPSGVFGVTELIQAACEISEARWVLRIDDDEFPSKEMLQFISYYVEKHLDGGNENISFSRHWLKFFDGSFLFFRSRARDFRENHYDGQFRLFFNKELQFHHNIHTSGMSTARSMGELLAPPDCFIVHFDDVLKSTDEKLSKMRRYEKIEAGSAWAISDLYLTEIYSDQITYSFHQDNIGQFGSLIQDIPKFINSDPPNLSDEEYQAIVDKCGVPGLKPRP